ncbi:MAG: adenylate/guanylate cyclase domain-containing protein [Proteobacteria bacterium]|nr:adenylate/guanylate cyclase domain-containing protein [Pseudomonadota bacterium]
MSIWKHCVDLICGEAAKEDMPARVRETIQDRQDDAERLVSWVQFILIVLFGGLWLVAPLPENMTMFQPVPWALGLYFAFTLSRLVAAHRLRLAPWYLYLSVVADIALLMVLIWSFHIQYHQPASFYLKAPTLMYAFIFIALRALRFEPTYVLTTGAITIAGWGVLMAYVLFAVPDDPMITRNYVTYLTSNSILVGAEIDKMVSIALVTLVLAIAVARAQRAFQRAAQEHSAAEDLSRFVSKEVAARITSSDRQIQPGDGEERVATVLFTDIEGFSTVSEKMSAKQLAVTLNEYFGAMGEVIDANGGVVTLFEGDLMLITFNAVLDDAAHAVNAVKCALAIQGVANSRTFNGVRLPTRCGINTGEIAVGAVGAKDRLVFTVHGDNVNIAARLEQLNKQYGTYIMLAEATCDAVGEEFKCLAVCETTVKGREMPVKVFTVAN